MIICVLEKLPILWNLSIFLNHSCYITYLTEYYHIKYISTNNKDAYCNRKILYNNIKYV